MGGWKIHESVGKGPTAVKALQAFSALSGFRNWAKRDLAPISFTGGLPLGYGLIC